MEQKLNTPKISIIDTHAHLDVTDFTNDCDAVIKRAIEAGVNRIITAGTSVQSSEKAVALAEKYPQVFAAAGIHPHEATAVQKADITQIAELAKRPRVVALGEMGLDFYRNYAPRDKQFQTLKWQLELASELCLPVIIHARQATKEMIEVLNDWVKKSRAEPPGVIHCFQENTPAAKAYLEMGFFLAFGGYIGYPNSHLAEVIKTVPENRLLVETDSPYLPPQKYRGKRNEPSYITITVETLAGVLGTSAEKVARQTTENANKLFRFK